MRVISTQYDRRDLCVELEGCLRVLDPEHGVIELWAWVSMLEYLCARTRRTLKLAVSAVRGMAGEREVTNERAREEVEEEREGLREEEALSADERYRPDRASIEGPERGGSGR